MAKVSDQRLRGIRASIPSNVVIGRVDKGTGKAQLLDGAALRRLLGPALSTAVSSSLSLTLNHIFVGNASNLPTDVAMSGDATIVASGALTLANTAVTPGTYGDNAHVGQFTVDSKGRLTFAANVLITGGGIVTSSYEWNPDDWNWGAQLIGPDGRAVYNNYQGGSYGSGRGVVSHSSGKFYFEFKIGAVHSPAPGVGVGSASATLTNFAGSDANAWAMWADGNGRNSGLTTSGSAYVAGDIVGVAVDFTASTGSIKFYKNNVLNVTYSALTLGTMYPIVTLQNNLTINWGRLSTLASEQTFAPPAGYSSWS